MHFSAYPAYGSRIESELRIFYQTITVKRQIIGVISSDAAVMRS